jgi:hypothetical protein
MPELAPVTLPSPQAIPTRFVNLDQARKLFGTRADRVGAYLRRSDDSADAAIAAAQTMSREAWSHAMRVGVSEGSSALGREVPRPIRAFFEANETEPAWLDHETVERGGRLVLRTGILSGLVFAARAIVLGYASPAGNKPLVMTGGLIEKAPKRLNETARYVRALIMPRGLQRFGPGYQASLRVRLMHAHVRSGLLARADWRTDDWGLPINQHDMAATTLLFSLILAGGLKKLGVKIREEEEEAHQHLWRYAGRLMGVDDALLPTGVQDASRLQALIEATQEPPDEDAKRLVRALCSAASNEAQTDDERRDAKRAQHLLRAAAYVLHGETLAESLGFEPTPFTKLGAEPLIRRIVRSGESLARMFPESQMRAGIRYWDAVCVQGLRLYGTPFQF